MKPTCYACNRSQFERLISRALSALLLVSLLWSTPYGHAQPLDTVPASDIHKQRVIVLSDIGADPDDTESMVRLLLYSDVIEIQGLIATTSTWKRTSVSPELIQAVVSDYAKVHGKFGEA